MTATSGHEGGVKRNVLPNDHATSQDADARGRRIGLLRYLTEAARIMGAEDLALTGGAQDGHEASDGKDGQPKQAGYSLLWYFEHLLARDLSPASPTYRPLLDAYLGADAPSIFGQPAPSDPQLDVTRRALKAFIPEEEPSLNENQTIAVWKGLHYPLSLVQGPPGTGKTAMIVRLVALALARGETVAVVSANRKAVENVEEKLAEARDKAEEKHHDDPATNALYAASLKLARLGNAERRAEAVSPLDGTTLGFERDGKKRRHHFPDGGAVGGWEPGIGFDEFTSTYPLVTSTVHSLKKCFRNGDERAFDLLVMDEASQASIVVGMVALSCAKRVVIVGDEKQLPPVLTDDVASLIKGYARKSHLFEDGGANSPYDISPPNAESSFLESCYQVFSDKNPNLKTRLTDHYRCHPAIIGFCNKEVYGGWLNVLSRPENADNPLPISIVWYEGDYREEVWLPKRASRREGNARAAESSAVNRKQLAVIEHEEAAHIRDAVRADRSICFLSPFRGQVYALERLLRRIVPEAGDAVEVHDPLAPSDEEREPERDALPCLTIHRAQGREFDVVYLLPVEDGNWEWPWSQGMRLVNVAASRAKEELHVILSTKLMGKGLQRSLAGRVTPARHPAQEEDDAQGREMYVRKLCDYVWERQQGLTDEQARTWVDGRGDGFHHTAARSIFDNLPFLQRRASGGSGPEECVRAALESMALLKERSLCWCQGVGFGQLRAQDGRALATLATDAGYEQPEQAHFDFVIYDERSRRVVMAIEVDGSHHRFKRGSDGGPDESVWERDLRKDRLVADVLRGEPATLGWCPWRKTKPKSGRPRPGGNPPSGRSEDEGAIWTPYPSRLNLWSSFVYLRIPSDGSTFCETESLQEEVRLDCPQFKAGEGDHYPPTIEEYLEAELRAWQSTEHVQTIGLYVAEGEDEGDKGKPISTVLHELGKEHSLHALLKDVRPGKMNEILERWGLIVSEAPTESASGEEEHYPTASGQELGILSSRTRKDGTPCPPYCRYTEGAVSYIRDMLLLEAGRSDPPETLP